MFRAEQVPREWEAMGMDGMRSRQVQRGLMRAGAKMCPYFRQSDGGEYEHIGCIMAIKYTPQSRNQLRIEIPGVIMRADAEHLEGLIPAGAEAPREGDRVRVEGAMRPITAAMSSAEGLYTLVLGEKDA